ncbi:hypothetical protein K469DRAFT_617173 [Zopfia rhizophila CBS 207.26]|uniref:Zn(2)-C6 fungal-type domain-containing protein n=1 Tax=Zopfia rhizophila CBS 207.26 TaxID=1314779 RepID=A0A6A6EUY0_9PEZI|nr:hypothetical protein K469DRAFT_617173 [Zopfia rhizophila CBS 207.26]
MVGVPGRSKGCATCRKRKKRCDLQRPSCGQCEERGLVCGGYERPRIFVHEDGKGSEGASLAEHGRAATQIILQRQSCPRGPQAWIALPEALARSAYGEKSASMFCEIYLPSERTFGSSTERFTVAGWTDEIQDLYVRDDALKIALLAVSCAVVGREKHDPWMIAQGRKLYGQGLIEVGKALKHKQRATSDALLTVPRLMGLFEILFGADPDLSLQARSWRSHAEGELAMMKARKPGMHMSGAAHRLFVDGRMSPIIAAVRARKATVMNSKEWKTIPWTIEPRTPKDSLIDILAGVPELLEEVERLKASVDGVDKAELRAKIAKASLALEADLDKWSYIHAALMYEPDDKSKTPITFDHLPTAHLTLHYWTTRTLVYWALVDVYGEPNSDILPTLDGRRNPCLYARRIARAVHCFFEPAAGIFGAHQAAFPICVALWCLESCGNSEKEYMRLVWEVFKRPNLPRAVSFFLKSMRQAAAQN